MMVNSTVLLGATAPVSVTMCWMPFDVEVIRRDATL
jgi:hypothetical protein